MEDIDPLKDGLGKPIFVRKTISSSMVRTYNTTSQATDTHTVVLKCIKVKIQKEIHQKIPQKSKDVWNYILKIVSIIVTRRVL